MTLSTARWMAPASFAIDFAAQNYGMLSNPNMKHIHDANLSFWSPQPYFIAGFFFPQQIFQVAWLWKLYKAKPNDLDNKNGSVDEQRHILDARHALMVNPPPYTSRNIGGGILGRIATAREPVRVADVETEAEFVADGLFCEWAYVVSSFPLICRYRKLVLGFSY